MVRVLVLLLLLLPGWPVAAETAVGPARIVDGDTLRVGETKVRLFGIDAPEMRQSCTRAGRAWACGRWAADVLAGLAGRGTIRCEGRARDGYDRLLAVCATRDLPDLGEAMVRAGAAFAYRDYSLAYVDAEKDALFAQVGVWAGDVELPADFRAAQRAAADAVAADFAAPASDCPIKGNISGRGERIYHVPGQADYVATRIDPRAGEQWFCTEAEARAAGWRPARR